MLNPILVAYDASGNEIALNPYTLSFGVQAHSLYFIQEGGYGASTGRFQLNYTEVPGSGTGLDFGSAISVGLSSSGSATTAGILGPLGSASVFQFQATASGQTRVTLTGSSPGSLAAFTVSNGVPTQVGGDKTEPGVMTFAVTLGQTYFVRVTSTGFGGSFSLDLQATAAPPPPDLQLPGKATLVTLGQVYVTDVAAGGAEPEHGQPDHSTARSNVHRQSDKPPVRLLPACMDGSGRLHPDRLKRGKRLHRRARSDQ